MLNYFFVKNKEFCYHSVSKNKKKSQHEDYENITVLQHTANTKNISHLDEIKQKSDLFRLWHLIEDICPLKVTFSNRAKNKQI